MAKAQRKRVDNRYVWRDHESGRFVDVVIADPAVRPKTVTVEKIRRAVRDVTKVSAQSTPPRNKKR
jgi:hypothetical protein